LLITNQVRAYDLLRMFSRNGNPTSLGQAFAEYGRIDKTLHLLDILDPIDDTCHRKLNKQLTVQESRQPYREDEDVARLSTRPRPSAARPSPRPARYRRLSRKRARFLERFIHVA
jgi:hypothetical protein